MSAKEKKTGSLKSEVVIYQAKDGAIKLRGDYRKETVWATQAQMVDIFGAERSVVTKHIRNILNDNELEAASVCAKFAHTADDGKTYQVNFYNLDVILAVGYRTNSARAITFRQWATKTLRKHIIDGYTINRTRIAKNYGEFLNAVEKIKALAPSGSAVDTASVLELVTLFADTWLSLDAYDKDKFAVTKTTKKKVQLTAKNLSVAIIVLKKELMSKGEATDLFASERSRASVEGIVGNVMQSFGGKDVYSSLEEKAAHLLYFVVKNHPFVDGNKRSGAFSFVWFLRKAGILNTEKLTPQALTALTLLIAESNPKDKERIIGLIMLLLRK